MKTNSRLKSPAFIVIAFLALSTIFISPGASLESSCTDDETFVFKTKNDGTEHGCDFVGMKRKKRCRKTATVTGEVVKVRDMCPVACQNLACTCRNSKHRFKATSSSNNIFRKKCQQNSDSVNGSCLLDPKVRENCPLECDSCSTVRCGDWPFGNPSLLSDGYYDKFSDSSLEASGVYSLLLPNPPKQVLGTFQGQNDGYCPDTIDLFCVTKCHEDIDHCDSVTAYNINNDDKLRFLCQFFNSQVPNAPLRMSPWIPFFPLKEGFSANSFVLKRNEDGYQEVEEFESSEVVPPDSAPPNGSESFQKYVLPGFACVQMNGGNPLDCTACVTEELTSIRCPDSTACDEIVRLTCQSGGLFGEGGSCQEECMSDKCLELAQQGVLASNGIYPTPLDLTKPGPYDDIGYGCVTKGIYDAEIEDFLDDYTCPPNQPKYVPNQPC